MRTDSMNRDQSHSALDSPPSVSSHTTSSSSRPSTASYASSSSNRGDIPLAQKGRTLHNAGQKLRLGRKKDRRRGAEDQEEEWTLEDGIPSRMSLDGGREQGVIAMEDSQLTEKASRNRKGEKESKGRRLAKKTSQMFSRKEKDRSNDDSQSNLSIPSGSRQASFSSATSGESSRTNSSSFPFNNLSRPPSHQSRHSQSLAPTRHANPQHTRRISQDSQVSWSGIRKTVRSGSSSTESPSDISAPIPQRQPSNLSASVPALSRSTISPPTQAPSSMSTRMSTWFTHFMSSSTPPEAVMAAPDPPSPARKPTSAAASFLNAARQRAVDGVRHLLDTEAQPDKSTETMWLMGVPHPGYRPGTPTRSPSVQSADLPEVLEERRGSDSSSRADALRPAAWPRRKDSGPMSPPSKSLGQLITGSTLSLVGGSPSKQDISTAADSPGRGRKAGKEKEVLRWPDAFYDDFRTRIWCTYRAQYAPILSLPNNQLLVTPAAYYAAFSDPTDTTRSAQTSDTAGQQPLVSKPSSWGWTRASEERGLTSDAGWGCMLRTGQSLLANALINLQLGRDWRIPHARPSTDPANPSSSTEIKAYATYVRIISYFFDDPSPLCPFSVHRMALIGKELGKEVGEWFGPSTASGALKTLTNSFPPCGLAVATATDGMVYKSDVYAASVIPNDGWVEGSSEARKGKGRWGHKAVLILVGLRLGLEGVNPIYHDSIKALFTFPQSVGIAGGRPNTSYYFVASQGNSLFYLDPHYTRPAVPLEIPPARSKHQSQSHESASSAQTPPMDSPLDMRESRTMRLDTVDVDDISDNSDNSLSPTKNRPKKSRHAKRLSIRSTPTQSPYIGSKIPSTPSTPIVFNPDRPIDVFDAPASNASNSPAGMSPTTAKADEASRASSSGIDEQTAWYLNAYTDTQLKTFHSEKVRKMPVSGLDPSMLLGFLVRDEAEFEDFCERVSRLPQKIFSVQDEPPSWDEDDAAGLESVSEPDMSDEEEVIPTVPGVDDEELVSGTAGLNLASSKGLRGGSSLEREDDDWDVPLSTQGIGGVIDRTATPNSIPVLVERPSMDMPKNAITPTSGTIRSSDALDIEDDVDGEATEGEDTVKERPKGFGRPVPGVRGLERQRTDSWVKPDRPEL